MNIHFQEEEGKIEFTYTLTLASSSVVEFCTRYLHGITKRFMQRQCPSGNIFQRNLFSKRSTGSLTLMLKEFLPYYSTKLFGGSEVN